MKIFIFVVNLIDGLGNTRLKEKNRPDQLRRFAGCSRKILRITGDIPGIG